MPCVKLQNRAGIIVSGVDRFDFLQGLITQDITLLHTQDLIYSCLLTPNGKFLFDFFVFQDGETLVIDCEGGNRADTLLKRLSMFKLRSDVALNLKGELDVFQLFPHCAERHDDAIQNINTAYKDPRFENGYRVYGAPSLQSTDFDIWDAYRIQTEIPDGSRDMIPEKSFLHESAVITETGISYTKGCYMGQELVSRMHHRGLVKKQLRCVDINTLPDDADLRSQSGDIGLALVKSTSTNLS